MITEPKYILKTSARRVSQLHALTKCGAPPYFQHEVRGFQDRHFTVKGIGRDEPLTWPSRSPDLNTHDFFFFLLCINDATFIPSLTTTLPELAERMPAKVTSLTPDLLSKV
jgi:hypothetical protein